jgi:hypothetical protein
MKQLNQNEKYLGTITMDSAAGSELFENYEQDFNTVKDSVRQKLNTQIPAQTGGAPFTSYGESNRIAAKLTAHISCAL